MIIKTALIAFSLIAVFGLVGADDYKQQVKQESYDCQMINSGKWGASVEKRELCKNLEVAK